MSIAENMKSKINSACVLVTFAILFTANIASAFYNPSLGRWANRDPLGDIASLPLMTASIAPSFESDGDGETSDEEFFDTWIDINRNLYGAMGNNPINSFDSFGLCPPVAIRLGLGAAAGLGSGAGAAAGGAGMGEVLGAFVVGFTTAGILSSDGAGGPVMMPPVGLSIVNAPPNAVSIPANYTKSWQHESPNPDKTKRRGDHKNRPDGKRDRDKQPKKEEPTQKPPPAPNEDCT
jgi:hypothetical protein